MISGWLLIALFPILPGQMMDIRAVVLSSYDECKDNLDDWKSAGAKIIMDCKKTNGTEIFVIMPEDYQ